MARMTEKEALLKANILFHGRYAYTVEEMVEAYRQGRRDLSKEGTEIFLEAIGLEFGDAPGHELDRFQPSWSEGRRGAAAKTP